MAIDGGLITPIVRNVEEKGIHKISSEIKELVEKAKNGTLSQDEYNGGTFSISNLGMYGIKNFTAIINPPQSAILAVGTGQKIPTVKKTFSVGFEPLTFVSSRNLFWNSTSFCFD